jgi:hypothetical protein
MSILLHTNLVKRVFQFIRVQCLHAVNKGKRYGFGYKDLQVFGLSFPFLKGTEVLADGFDGIALVSRKP